MYDVVVFVWLCMLLVCIPNYYVMVRCNDILLAKVFQYVALSLVGPSSSSRIGSHIGRDNLLDVGCCPLDCLQLDVVESRGKLFRI